ncbi:MAG: NADH-quinone oxidoreductase subunit C/D [Halieaceae bacterium]|jgi:NADH-quinone oxidoreductase subunit C/D|nr:NADH-quinone oxidoreductase subunit C/D [Halieaceae bacterium]
MNTEAASKTSQDNSVNELAKENTTVGGLFERFGDASFTVQPTADEIPTLWVSRDDAHQVLGHLKSEIDNPYSMLYDLTGIDERQRQNRAGQPASEFTTVYHLISPERNEDIRIKVPLQDSDLKINTISDLWPAANWYEREAYDMFGIDFEGHPNLTRILCPSHWQGHPLRKEHPTRATDMEDYVLTQERVAREQEALRIDPEALGIAGDSDRDTDYMYLNLGPNHPSAHGAFRIILKLDGEEIVEAIPEIGYHHRGVEKIGERQSWHSFIPYTDRIDYVAGVMNNLPYVLSVEKLAGIVVPERVEVIRVMLSEMSRILSHLLFYGTVSQDLGLMSPTIYLFNDREKLYKIIEAITGGRQHPSWFRIGGVAHDLPIGWQELVRDFLAYMPGRMDEYEKIIMQNAVVKQRTRGISAFTTADAMDWSITGPMLRATGSDWDIRKKRPYSGYDKFDFEVPTGVNGDIYDRVVMRAEEIRQSLRIIQQCMDNMPEGPYKADHKLTTPPPKERTMQDIETLIQHFTNVSWGPVIPAGEACIPIEATKGMNGYYLISDGNTSSYRTRIRTPSFIHLQMIPFMCKGLMIADLIAILAGIDYVMADVDR